MSGNDEFECHSIQYDMMCSQYVRNRIEVAHNKIQNRVELTLEISKMALDKVLP